MAEGWWEKVWYKDFRKSDEILNLMEKKLDIKLLAFDLDLTLLDINTGGRWKKSAEKLAGHVRPSLKALMESALIRGHPKMCMVTFSVQLDLIKKLLQLIFPNHNTSQIIIVHNAENIRPQLSIEVYRTGKQRLLNKVLEKFENIYRWKPKPEEIFLFEDRRLYVYLAKREGLHGFLVNDKVSLNKILKEVHEISKKKEEKKKQNIEIISQNLSKYQSSGFNPEKYFQSTSSFSSSLPISHSSSSFQLPISHSFSTSLIYIRS